VPCTTKILLAQLAGQAKSPNMLTQFEKSQMTENRIDSKGSAFFFEGAAVPTIKSDSLVLEPIIKSDSNLPKRKTRHNRSVTPMGNITDML